MINWFRNLFKKKEPAKLAPVDTPRSTFAALDSAHRATPTKSQMKRIAAQSKPDKRIDV